MTSIARARDAADLLVLLPYQLGYHPRRSVVLVLMDDRRIRMMQRLDIPPRRGDPEPITEQALAVVARQRPTSVLVAAFEDEQGESRLLRRAVTKGLRRLGVPIHDHVVACAGRYYEPWDRSAPAWGRPLPSAHEVPAVAEFVRLGIAPLADRTALVDSLVPAVDGRAAGRVEAALDDVTTWEDAVGPGLRAQVWRDVLDPDPGATPVRDLPPRRLAVAIASLLDVQWRDALLGVLCPGAIPSISLLPVAFEDAQQALTACVWTRADGEVQPSREVRGSEGADPTHDADVPDVPDSHEGVARVQQRVADLIACTPLEERPPVLTILGGLVWWTGDGTGATSCLEAALLIEPDYRLAMLMLQLLRAGIRPEGWSMTSGGARAEPAAPDPLAG